MSGSRILVVDDEPDIRDLVCEILEDEGYAVSVAPDAESARRACHNATPDLALLDIWMPGTDGITLLQEWRQHQSEPFPVIMMSGHGTIETAVEATRLGARDFVEKPLSMTKLLLTVRNVLAEEPQIATGMPRGNKPAPELIGTSRVIANLRERVERVAATSAPALVRGEPGSGRHIVARLVHAGSARSDMRCVEVDVGAIGVSQVGDALFGTDGAWQAAVGGSLILNDIAELDAAVQARLASTLGASTPASEPRLIAITGEHLETLIERGSFRADLLQALTVSLQVPPLREHAEDVPDLVGHIVDRLVEHHGLPYRHFPVSVQNRLLHHDWPGNIAGLEAVVQQLLVMAEGTEVDVEEVDAALAATPPPVPPATAMRLPLELPLRAARDAFERAYFEHQLRIVGGRIGELAQRVGMERTHLYRKLRNLGIDHTRSRQ